MNGTPLDQPAPPADNSNIQSCGGAEGSRRCEFFREHAGAGICVRNPPTAIVLMMPEPLSASAVLQGQKARAMPSVQGFWPPVPTGGWCGEWNDAAGEADDGAG